MVRESFAASHDRRTERKKKVHTRQTHTHDARALTFTHDDDDSISRIGYCTQPGYADSRSASSDSGLQPLVYLSSASLISFARRSVARILVVSSVCVLSVSTPTSLLPPKKQQQQHRVPRQVMRLMQSKQSDAHEATSDVLRHPSSASSLAATIPASSSSGSSGNTTSSSACNYDAILHPLDHQVGGHTQLMLLDQSTVAKPLIQRELLFYLNIPRELRPFVPSYKGKALVVTCCIS